MPVKTTATPITDGRTSATLATDGRTSADVSSGQTGTAAVGVSYLLTEASDFSTTEAADRLILE